MLSCWLWPGSGTSGAEPLQGTTGFSGVLGVSAFKIR